MYRKNDLRIVQGVTAALGLTPTGDSASRSATERRDSRACQPTKNQVSAQESAQELSACVGSHQLSL